MNKSIDSKNVVLFFPKLEEDKDFHHIPVSILSVAAPLVGANIPCQIIDERVDPDFLKRIDSALTNASCFLVTAYTGYQVNRAYTVSRYVKETFPEVKVVWGGPHVTALPRQSVQSDFVDIVFCGYAEAGIVELVTTLIKNGDLSKVPNILYTDAKNDIIETERTNPRLLPDDFKQLPYSLIDLPKYINPKTKRFIYVSSYGCPGICTFCATKTLRRWTPIDVTRVTNDIASLMSNYDFKECLFFDATAFTKVEGAKALSQIMQKYGLRWLADARAQELYRFDDESLKAVIESGLIHLVVGLESGSQKIVNIMKKGPDHLLRFEKVAARVSRFDIKMVSGVIFGCPGETVDDLQETIDYILKIKKINPGFFISTTFFKPLPDTVLYDVVCEKGYQVPNSLESWAEAGASNHFKYNEWMNNAWMKEIDVETYRRVYDDFRKEHSALFA